jgi:hypothetical protein
MFQSVSNVEEDFEADIDLILERSMQKTKEINKGLESIEQKLNLNNISLNGDTH